MVLCNLLPNHYIYVHPKKSVPYILHIHACVTVLYSGCDADIEPWKTGSMQLLIIILQDIQILWIVASLSVRYPSANTMLVKSVPKLSLLGVKRSTKIFNKQQLRHTHLLKVYLHSPEPWKLLCKQFIQELHTSLMAYFSHGTYS